jgi:homogentisate 1,2-dioxygenase
MFYRRVGNVPHKRHTIHRDGDGTRLLEELVGEEGFAGASSLLYHRHSPSALVSVDAVDDDRTPLTPLQPVVPMHVRTAEFTGVIAGNDDLRICVVRHDTTTGLYRDAVGDQLVYVQDGSGALETSMGALDVRAGDYVVVPRGVAHRWVVEESALQTLTVEASGHIRPPAKYLSSGGQFREHAPYCERDLRAPLEPLVVDGDAPTEVVVRTRSGLTRHIYAHHPFDVVGWDGGVYPWALSIHDFEPIVGSLHQPPPVHQTFEGNGFVVCSFVPRPFDFHPEAVKIPYHHSNVDSDEVIYYSQGDFMSRAGAGIGIGSITLHPAGFVHGPQPGSFEGSVDATRTEEVAVMIDTFKPLLISDGARSASDQNYLHSWS